MKIKEINIKDVTLGEYQEIMIKDEVTEEDFLKCFLKVTTKELNNIPQKYIDGYVSEINNALTKEYELVRTFKLDGVNYGFIPKLDDITYGENLDISKYIGEYGSMHKAMAVLFRPIEHTYRDQYLIEEYSGSYMYAEKMKQMPLDIVLGAVVFFYNLTSELLNYTLKYLEQQVQMDSGLKTTLQENGADIVSSIHSLKEMLRDLKPLQN
jgi:hypothetical protein|tara:strand:+ start:174 stop:803 length:630 start_codon:yes stop_codon:yes gene_type:complete